MEILIAHLFGDYVIQSDWMAQNKTKNSIACAVHCITYGLPFLFVTQSVTALAVIVGTHFILDRWRLARYVVYAKNFFAPLSVWVDYDCRAHSGEPCKCKYRWEDCKATGYPSETPIWLATWLLIIADNTIHLLINYLAVKYL